MGRKCGKQRRHFCAINRFTRWTHQAPGWRLSSGLLGGLAPSAALRRTLGRWFADQFRAPYRGDELLQPVIVEVNRRALGIRFRHHSEPVLVMPNSLSLNQNLHRALLGLWPEIVARRCLHPDVRMPSMLASHLLLGDVPQPERPRRLVTHPHLAHKALLRRLAMAWPRSQP